MELPSVTETPVLYVDSTPDEEYPLRILRAYRQNCNCMWAEDTSGEKPTRLLLRMMNEDNLKRAALLDKAIARLIE